MKKSVQTNKEFTMQCREFQVACGMVPIPVTIRQASKWRMKKGSAYSLRGEAGEVVATQVHAEIEEEVQRWKA